MDYELEPERPTDTPPAVDDRSTEHHESLLRAEAARASRTNRVLGSLVVAGFAAATVVGIVTWQGATTDHDGRGPVEEAVADGSMSASADRSADPSRDERATTDPTPDDGESVSGQGDVVRPDRPQGDHVTPLTADQYAPPNAWSGDQFVTPSPYPTADTDAEDGSDGAPGDGAPDGAGTEVVPDDGSSEAERPSITDLLPSITGLPSLPGHTGESESTGEPEDTGTSEPAEPTEPSEPSEPSDPADPSGERTPDSTPDSTPDKSTGERPSATETPESSGAPRSTENNRDAVTDTTGPALR
ncbi:hypothetical protein [Corynebacterium sp.]|uniref:hypothetical protein n=1 Tax=Corynebacterium sp. TaxID=1720 RepID=UPI0025B8D744|nr:hypothetical protein [Corynebacterium sp.]